MILYSKRLLFRGIEECDLQFMIDCRNKPEIAEGFYENEPISYEMQRIWFSKFLDRFKNGTEKMWIINEKVTNYKVGTTAITHIDWRNRKAEWERHLIDTPYWGKGYSQEAEALLFKYVFENLNMNKFYCKIIAENGIQKTHIKFGFKEVGTLQQDVYKNGEYKDSVVLELLREDYFKHTKKYSEIYF